LSLVRRHQALPALAWQSITFDRGTEFSSYRLLKQKLGIDSYFCKPQAPWQKGTVENTNSRVQRVLSRDAAIAALSDETLLDICERLNETPRKCLGYRTPVEVLMSSLDPGPPELRNPDQRSPGSPWVRGYPSTPLVALRLNSSEELTTGDAIRL
jgi:transposase, IS30 family